MADPFDAPQTDPRPEAGELVLSAGWRFNLPKVQRVFWTIAAVHAFGLLGVMAIDGPPAVKAVAAGFQLMLAGIYVGLAYFANRKPMVATWIGFGFFFLIQVLPTLLAPAQTFLTVLTTLFCGALLLFAYKTSRQLSHLPRMVRDD